MKIGDKVYLIDGNNVVHHDHIGTIFNRHDVHWFVIWRNGFPNGWFTDKMIKPIEDIYDEVGRDLSWNLST